MTRQIGPRFDLRSTRLDPRLPIAAYRSGRPRKGTSPTRSSWSLISFALRSAWFVPVPTAFIASSCAPAADHFCAPFTISVNGKLNGSARSKRLPSGSSAPTGPGLPVHSTSPSDVAQGAACLCQTAVFRDSKDGLYSRLVDWLSDCRLGEWDWGGDAVRFDQSSFSSGARL